MTIAEQFLSEYLLQGVVFPLPALSECESRRAFEQYVELCRPGTLVLEGPARVFAHVVHRWVADLISHPKVLGVVESLIGPNIFAWVSEFNSKAPRSPHFFSWHQDMYYWRHQYKDLRTIPMVTVWLALSPANEVTGGMRVIPGSHHELVSHEEKPSEHNLLTRAQCVSAPIEESKAVAINLHPGEFSVHHPLIYHASGPNESDTARVALVTRYMAPEVIPPIRPAYGWLVRGEDKYHNWDHLVPAGFERAVEMRQKCIESVQRITGSGFK